MPHAKSSVLEEATMLMTTTTATTTFYNAKVQVKSLHTVKAYRQNRARAPHILYCNCGWRRVASFMPPAALPPGKELMVFIEFTLVRPQNQSECFWR